MAHPETFTDTNFDEEVLKHSGVALVDFWASWCMPCRMVAPVIDELAGEYEGRIKVGKLNVDENTRTAANYGVMSIPTLLIFENGEVVDKVVGAQPKQAIAAHLDEVLAKGK